MADPAAPANPASVPSDIALYCPACMYDLRGLPGEQCPECGGKLDRELLAKSSIPWVHREGLGIAPFFKTAMRATFKTEFFCTEVARPVSLLDARKFRRRVIWLLTIAGVICWALLALMLEDFREPLGRAWSNRPWLVVCLLPIIAGMLFLYFAVLTGMHMVWFHPKALSIEQQNRAVALSHYACAPLLWLVPTVSGLCVSIVLGAFIEDAFVGFLGWFVPALWLICVFVIVLAVPAYLFVCARMAQHTSNRSGITRLMLWPVLPLLWLLWSGLMFFVLPLVGVYIYVIFSTI